jgi:elongator complex protein 3
MRTYDFDPEPHEAQVQAIVSALAAKPELDDRGLQRLLTRHPKAPGALFSKSELIRAIRHFGPRHAWDAPRIIERLRMKPVRSHSGVAPVTVLTKPFPCPGRCVFCPNDVRMPKSYLSMEPGAQRAAQNRFDPYAQTMTRLRAFFANGHAVDKVELIVLGGTWTHYPEAYRIWFVERCFAALNDFDPGTSGTDPAAPSNRPDVAYEALPEKLDGRAPDLRYNRIVQSFWRSRPSAAATETASWSELEAAHIRNQDAHARCVGLSLETRPDEIDETAVRELRRLGATKIQIGLQSLDDDILERNQRGHDVATSRRAVALLRAAGFKVQAHWMANLLGATPESDCRDFDRLFGDPDFRPDELKLYPNALIESSELMVYWESGAWRPYDDDELLSVVMHGLERTPRYCRLSRVIRDIPGHDIVVGNKQSNFRERAEAELNRQGRTAVDVRAREVRRAPPPASSIGIETTAYDTGIGEERFIEAVARGEQPSGRLAGFCRLALPRGGMRAPAPELEGAAIVRELHVYGPAAELGARGDRLTQHGGLGRRLLAEAERQAAAAGFARVAVISAVGTRRYYEARGYRPMGLYHLRPLHPPDLVEGSP